MFCMNCGQVLPDGAKFCLSCGTPQGQISPAKPAVPETVNLDGSHTLVPAMCPNCNSHMNVDPNLKIARCEYCGTECLVQEAIKNINLKGNVKVGNAIININGTNTEGILQRAELLLSSGDFAEAHKKCESILDMDPTNGRLYALMLLAELKCRDISQLAEQKSSFEQNQNYVYAVRFGDSDLRAKLQYYNNQVITKLESERIKFEAEQEYKRRNPKVGDELYIGTFDGKMICWQVLYIQDRSALLICSKNICNMQFHVRNFNATWNTSYIRKWLNNNFFGLSFTREEKERIIVSQVNNENNPQFNTPGGGPTNDKVFLLSISEAEKYFANDKARAINTWWWLRTPGHNDSCAAGVYVSGGVNAYGEDIQKKRGVRPAMWINLDA